MMGKVWGRVKIHGKWRPASLTHTGEMFVAPSEINHWRHPTEDERATWQIRHREHQRTVGRIWDDELYPTTQLG